MAPEIKIFFEPKSVVLLGASELKGEGATSAECFRSLADNISKFKKGKVYGVDLSGKLEGYEKKLAKVPTNCDLTAVSLPKELLIKNLSNLLAKKTKTLVLISDGLDRKQRETLASLAKRGRLLLLGPRATMGVINTANSFVATPRQDITPKQGHIGLISQDSGFAASMLDWTCFHGVGISKFACIGDGLGIDIADLLRYLARDKETRVICVYIDTIKEGRKLVEAIGEAVKSKPVVVLKGGLEHDRIFESALKQVGAFQAQSVEEVFAVAEALAKQPPMHGKRVAVITNAVGQARLLTRFLEQEGLVLAEPSAETVKKISKKHSDINISGFIDLGEGANADLYKLVVQQVLSDKTVDGIVVINAVKSTLLEPDDILSVADAAKRSKNKPVIDLTPGGRVSLQTRELLVDAELPVYDQPEKAARVMKFLSVRGRILEKISPIK